MSADETMDDIDVLDCQEPLCDRCDASFRAHDDTLCEACRADVDQDYSELPGAEE